MTHLINLVIDGGVLLNVEVSAGDISLRLIVVVVTDEKLDCVFRKEFLEFSV